MFTQSFVPLRCSAAVAAQQTRLVPGNHRNLQAGTGPGNNELLAQVQHWDLLSLSANVSPALPHLTHRGKLWQWLQGTQKGRKPGILCQCTTERVGKGAEPGEKPNTKQASQADLSQKTTAVTTSTVVSQSLVALLWKQLIQNPVDS